MPWRVTWTGVSRVSSWRYARRMFRSGIGEEKWIKLKLNHVVNTTLGTISEQTQTGSSIYWLEVVVVEKHDEKHLKHSSNHRYGAVQKRSEWIRGPEGLPTAAPSNRESYQRIPGKCQELKIRHVLCASLLCIKGGVLDQPTTASFCLYRLDEGQATRKW